MDDAGRADEEESDNVVRDSLCECNTIVVAVKVQWRRKLGNN